MLLFQLLRVTVTLWRNRTPKLDYQTYRDRTRAVHMFAGIGTTAYNYVWQRRGVGRLSAAKKRVVCVACVADSVQCCVPSSS